MKAIKNRLSELRTKRHLSQTDLGKIFNVAQNTISQWELGTRNIDNHMLIQLAEYYQVSIDYILCYEGNKLNTADTETTTEEIDHFAIDEIELIKKYRALSRHGKEIVTTLLEQQYNHEREKLEKSLSKITA